MKNFKYDRKKSLQVDEQLMEHCNCRILVLHARRRSMRGIRQQPVQEESVENNMFEGDLQTQSFHRKTYGII